MKIAYAGAFINDLRRERKNPERTDSELRAIQIKYNKKMTVYIFTCSMAGQTSRARAELKNWDCGKNVKMYLVKTGLWISSFLPTRINRGVYKLRLRLF